MNIVRRDGSVIGARRAIHDAHLTGLKSQDFKTMVQHSGGDNNLRIVNLCEQGKILHELDLIHAEKPESWAWAVLAYAPDNTINFTVAFSLIYPLLVSKSTNEKFKPLQIPVFMKLCERALCDSVLDARAGKRNRHKREELAVICKCSKEEYERGWRFVYYNLKDMVHDLDRDVLPRVGSLLWEMAGDEAIN